MLVTCAVGDDDDLWWCHRGLGRMSPTPLPRVVPMKRRTESVSVLPPRSELQSGPPLKKRAPRGMCTLENFQSSGKICRGGGGARIAFGAPLAASEGASGADVWELLLFFLLTWSYGTYALLRRWFLMFLVRGHFWFCTLSHADSALEPRWKLKVAATASY